MSFLYMPILKWKQGEQLTLKALDDADKNNLLPLVELLPIKPEYLGNLKERLAQHLTANAKHLVKAGYDSNPVGIDITAVEPGYHSQTRLLAATIKSLRRTSGVNAIPVILPAMVLSDPDHLSSFGELPAVILRIRVGTFLADQVDTLINGLRAALGSDDTAVHVLFDMYDIVGTSPSAKADELTPLINAAYATPNVETVTIAGGSFLLSLQGLKQGMHLLPRVELQAYKQLRAAGYDQLRFGDYTVTNPLPLEGLDPTTMNPSAQIRYARQDDWLLFKAGGSKTYGMGQYNGLCHLLVAHEDYCQPDYSMGDARYHYHTTAGATTGSYMTWRRDATSHHIVFTARQMVELHGA
jgi:hypothetical protein